MDPIKKALAKLSLKERIVIKSVLGRLISGETNGMDIKKLKDRDDIFRVRKGDMRIIYQKQNGQIILLAIKRRNEATYKW
jgi:mRNA-degrading endonuclease RelE of RelBE toxin-antitoxin system